MEQVPSPLNVLSNRELQIVLKALSMYSPDSHMATALSELKSRLRFDSHGTYATISHSLHRLNTDTGEVIMLNPKDSPMIKFVKCPDKLNVSALDYGVYGRLNVTMNAVGGLELQRELYNGSDQRIALSQTELETLVAFAIYHMEKRRGDYVEYITPDKQEQCKTKV